MDAEKAKPAAVGQTTERASTNNVHVSNEHTASTSTGGLDTQPAFQISLNLRRRPKVENAGGEL